MFVFFFNLIGVGMLLGAFVLVALLGVALGPIGVDVRYPNSIYYLAATLLIIDLAYRYVRVRPRLDAHSQNWLTDAMGGRLMLMPAWACAILGIILWVLFGGT